MIKKYLIIIAVFLLLAACSDPVVPLKVSLINYEAEPPAHMHHKTVQNKEELAVIHQIMDQADWKKGVTEKKPQYSFFFDNPNAKSVPYKLAVKSKKKAVIIEADYSQAELNAADSFRFFEILDIR
ncbi:hypothetical protein [Peribacillus sp. SCS-37]|uniref:hypothetical protein n=1 Tax=Paraperibacillus esterisolvens TaxID=3115296 RepID=UPI00390641D5